MATTIPRDTMRARGEQALRDAWQTVGRHTSSGLARVVTFLSAFPLLAQGIYYLLRGLWSLLSPGSADLWRVKTLAVLVLVIGAALCLAAYRKQWSPEIVLIAFGSALGLAALDLIYVVRRVISPLYLLDALVQIGLIGLWIYGWRKGLRQQQADLAAPPPAGLNGTAPPGT